MPEQEQFTSFNTQLLGFPTFLVNSENSFKKIKKYRNKKYYFIALKSKYLYAWTASVQI